MACKLNEALVDIIDMLNSKLELAVSSKDKPLISKLNKMVASVKIQQTRVKSAKKVAPPVPPGKKVTKEVTETAEKIYDRKAYANFATTIITYMKKAFEAREKTPIKVSIDKDMAIAVLKGEEIYKEDIPASYAYARLSDNSIIYADFTGLVNDDATLDDIMESGRYQDKEALIQTIKANSNQWFSQMTRVHEHIHITAMDFMYKNPKDSNTIYINNLYKKLLKVAEKDKYLDSIQGGYWKTNVDEFLAVSLSHPKMVNYLNKMKTTEKRSVLHKLVSVISGIVGIKVDSEAGFLFDSLLQIADRGKVLDLNKVEDDILSEPKVETGNIDLGAIVDSKGRQFFVKSVTNGVATLVSLADGKVVKGKLEDVAYSKKLPSTIYNNVEYFYDNESDTLFSKNGEVWKKKNNPQRKAIVSKFADEKVKEYKEVSDKVEDNVPKKDTNYELFPGVMANEGQKIAIDGIASWFSKNLPTYLLRGRGGTGKTTVINKVLENMGIKPEEVMFATPTHKARKVIEDANSSTIYKNSDYSTIASLLGIKPKKGTKDTFVVDPKARLKKLPKLLVVDEASMITRTIYNKLLNRASSEGTKVIFMGDEAQLPPIEDNAPLVYSSVVFDNHKEASEVSTSLKERMRQKDNSPIVPFTDTIVELIESFENDLEKDAIKVKNFVADGNKTSFDAKKDEGIIFSNDNDDVILDSYIKSYKKSPTGTKIIHFQNENNPITKKLTARIRNMLYGDEAKNRFVKDEQVMLNDAYEVNEADPLINGSEYTVISAVKDTKTVTYKVGKHIYDTPTLDIIKLEIKDNDNGKTYTVDVLDGNTAYNLALQEQKKYRLQTPPYDIKNNFANINYSYLINAHKSQGSSYDNVYLDQGSILGLAGYKDVTANVVAKALYVGSSRPRKKLIVFANKNKSSIINAKSITNYELNEELWKHSRNVVEQVIKTDIC